MSTLLVAGCLITLVAFYIRDIRRAAVEPEEEFTDSQYFNPGLYIRNNMVCCNKNNDALIAILSSRINQELVSKAYCIGTEIVAGVSAPTSYAVELAKKCNITLVGFLRKRRFSIYTVPERVT